MFNQGLQLFCGSSICGLSHHEVADGKTVTDDWGGGFDQPGMTFVNDTFTGSFCGFKGSTIGGITEGDSFR